MELFEQMAKEGHEQLLFFQEKKSGLKAVVAIHNSVLGPALGGCRMWPYESEDEAIMDALRLSKGMTYKSGISGEDFGGGKTVIWGDPQKDKSEALIRALGRFINGLGGRYSTGTDVGTTYNDFVIMRKETPWVGALPKEYGGSGDSSIPTAYGVYNGIKACCQQKYGSDSLQGKTVAVQGLGKVGSKLVKRLIDDGCKVIATDVNPDYIKRGKELGAEIVEPDEIFDIKCDIFSPNALGAVINDDTLSRLKCDIIAGAANNVLARPEHGDQLKEMGILYAPDYLINAGGLIQVTDELHVSGYSEERVMKKCEGIFDKLMEVFRIAEERDIPTHIAADQLVEDRIENMATIHSIMNK